jgi:hypothetical protein
MRKLLAHFVAQDEKQDELILNLQELAKDWSEGIGGDRVQATLMRAHVEDPMRLTGAGTPTRACDASIEIKLAAAKVDAELEAAVCGLADEFEDLIQRDLCAVQIGTDKPFVACEPTPIRFQYCMRRRHDFTHAAYLARYEGIHSRFGLATKGIEGYYQFQIDLEVTERACASAGVGVASFDSVSELHIGSMAAFLGAAAENAKIGAGQDEDAFVDRPSSFMWISDEIFRLGY